MIGAVSRDNSHLFEMFLRNSQENPKEMHHKQITVRFICLHRTVTDKFLAWV